MSLTLWAFNLNRTFVERRARLLFETRMEQLKLLIQSRLKTQEQILKSGVALFSASDQVTRPEWKTFYEKLELDRTYPGVEGLGFATRFPPSAKDSLERSIRAEGYPGFTVVPQGLRPEMTAIVFLEPFRGRNLRAFGYDMFSEPVRRAAMERARDSGLPSITGRVLLVQEREDDPARQAGFLMYLPVYRKGADLSTVERRREALVGYVYSPFRMGDFMQVLLPPSLWNLDFAIYDGEGSDPQRWMHGNIPASGRVMRRSPLFSGRMTLDLNGHRWTILASTPPSFPRSADWHQPKFLLIGGIIISLLLFWVTATLASTRQKAESLAQEMTREMRVLGESLEMRVRERTRELNEALEAVRESEERLRQSQKMEAIGRLAGGIAHDFNNLLTAINGYAALGLAQLDKSHPVHENLEEIEKAGKRAADLTMRLLAYSRKQIMTPRVVSLNAVVADLDRMLRRLLGADIRMETRLAPDIGWIKVDPGQIQQVIINLAINARDAMPKGGLLSISTLRERLAEPDARGKVGEDARNGGEPVPPGEYAVLVVEDNGMGMDAAVLSRLFEPYFTTKPAGRGTGLGLPTVHGIVHQSGGSIQVFSTPGQGTRFRILLPVASEGAVTPDLESPEESGDACAKTLLVAEDEEVVGNLLRSVLEKAGFKVLLGRDGEEALALSRMHAEPIHLLLTDVVMFPMGGRELAERFQAERPDTPVVFMSGYSDDEVLKQGIRENPDSFLRKPFSPEEVVKKIRACLKAKCRPPSDPKRSGLA